MSFSSWITTRSCDAPPWFPSPNALEPSDPESGSSSSMTRASSAPSRYICAKASRVTSPEVSPHMKSTTLFSTISSTSALNRVRSFPFVICMELSTRSLMI